MTDQELAQLDKRFDALTGSVGGLASDVKALTAGNATLAATVKERTKRHGEEIAALFGKCRDHDKRIGKVEKHYTPRDEHEKAKENNRAEHDDFAQDIVEVRSRVAYYAGGAAALAVLAMLAAAVWKAVAE